MPTDAVILEHVENIVIPTSMKTLVQLAPMQPGRSYVIWGMGSVSVSNAKITFELEAFDARDTVELIYSDRALHTSFSLAVGTTLPADDELFTVAKVAASAQAFSGGLETSLAVVLTAKLVVLAVDSVAVQAV